MWCTVCTWMFEISLRIALMTKTALALRAIELLHEDVASVYVDGLRADLCIDCKRITQTKARFRVKIDDCANCV